MKRILNLPSLFEEKVHTLLKFGVAAIILAVPLYPKFPLFNVPGTTVAIRLEDFLVLLVSLIWFVAIIPNIRKFIAADMTRAIFLFWAIGLLSCVAAIFLTQTVAPFVALLNWGRRVQYMMCFFIGVSSIKSKEDLKFYIKCLLVVVIYVFIVGAGQKYFHWPVITTQNGEYSKGQALFYMPGGHLVSTFAGHYDMAALMIFIIPFFITLAFAKKEALSDLFGKFPSMWSRVLLFFVSAMGLWLLIEAASRISTLAYFGSFTLVLILTKKIRWIPVVMGISILITVLAGGSLESRYVNLLDVVKKKVIGIEIVKTSYAATSKVVKPTATPVILVTATPTSTPVPVLEDRSTNIRLAVEWPRAIRALTKNPFLGTGYSSITLATDNDYLRMLGEVGLLGTLSFGIVIVRIILVLLPNMFKRKSMGLEETLVLSILGALPGIFLTMVFIDVLEASKFAILFWLILGIAVATVKLMKNNEK